MKILLSVEANLIGLKLAKLDVNLVAAHHNRNIAAASSQVAVPVTHIFVGNPRGQIEHYNGTLTSDVISIA